MKKIWKAWRKWQAKRMIMDVARIAPELLMGHVQEKAAELSTEVTMAFLAREGIVRCFKCPRRAPLFKVSKGVYACRFHAEEGKKAFEQGPNKKPVPATA